SATVCARWRSLQQSRFRCQKALTLLVGPEDTAKVIKSSKFNQHHQHLLRNDDGSRMFPRPVFNLENDVLRCGFDQFERPFDATAFVSQFPNIIHFRVGIDRRHNNIRVPLCGLLRHWASQLVTFELYYPSVPPDRVAAWEIRSGGTDG